MVVVRSKGMELGKVISQRPKVKSGGALIVRGQSSIVASLLWSVVGSMPLPDYLMRVEDRTFETHAAIPSIFAIRLSEFHCASHTGAEAARHVVLQRRIAR